MFDVFEKQEEKVQNVTISKLEIIVLTGHSPDHQITTGLPEDKQTGFM